MQGDAGCPAPAQGFHAPPWVSGRQSSLDRRADQSGSDGAMQHLPPSGPTPHARPDGPQHRPTCDTPDTHRRGRLPSIFQGFGFADDSAASSTRRGRSADKLAGNLGRFTLSGGSGRSRPSSLTRHSRMDEANPTPSSRSIISGPSGATTGPLPHLTSWSSRRSSACACGDEDGSRCGLTPSSLGYQRRTSYANGYTGSLQSSRAPYEKRYSRSSVSGPIPDPPRAPPPLRSSYSLHTYPPYGGYSQVCPSTAHLNASEQAVGLTSPASDGPARPNAQGPDRGHDYPNACQYQPSSPLPPMPAPDSDLHPSYTPDGFYTTQDYPRPIASVEWTSSYPNLPVGVVPSPAGPPPPRTSVSTPAIGQPAGMPRPFKCTSCGAAFVRNHDLRRHCRIHLSTKPFACPDCQKPFSRKDALNRHVQVKECAGRRRRREFRVDSGGGRRASGSASGCNSGGVQPVDVELGNELQEGSATSAEPIISSKEDTRLDLLPNSHPRLSQQRQHRHSWTSTAVTMPPPGKIAGRGSLGSTEYIPPERLSSARNSLPDGSFTNSASVFSKPRRPLSCLGPPPSEGSLRSAPGAAGTGNRSRASSGMSMSSMADSIRTDAHSAPRSSMTTHSVHVHGHDEWVPPSHPDTSVSTSVPHAHPWGSYSHNPPAPHSLTDRHPHPSPLTALTSADQHHGIIEHRSSRRASLVHFADPWVPPQ